MKVKVNWSGGKDSTAAFHMNIVDGHECTGVCYIPYLTNTIPLICAEQLDFLMTTADRFIEMGAAVNFVHGLTYYDYVTHRALKGKFKGRMFGFPCIARGMCGFKRDSKIKSLKSVMIECDYEDIGIAFDETDRFSSLDDKHRSILVEKHFTENDALEYCKIFNLLSPTYSHQKRDGCALCPHASKEERERYFSDWQGAIEVVLELQEIVKRERPGQTPLRNYEWFI